MAPWLASNKNINVCNQALRRSLNDVQVHHLLPDSRCRNRCAYSYFSGILCTYAGRCLPSSDSPSCEVLADAPLFVRGSSPTPPHISMPITPLEAMISSQVLDAMVDNFSCTSTGLRKISRFHHLFHDVRHLITSTLAGDCPPLALP